MKPEKTKRRARMEGILRDVTPAEEGDTRSLYHRFLQSTSLFCGDYSGKALGRVGKDTVYSCQPIR